MLVFASNYEILSSYFWTEQNLAYVILTARRRYISSSICTNGHKFTKLPDLRPHFDYHMSSAVLQAFHVFHPMPTIIPEVKKINKCCKNLFVCAMVWSWNVFLTELCYFRNCTVNIQYNVKKHYSLPPMFSEIVLTRCLSLNSKGL